MSAIIVIPARLSSTRLPDKPMLMAGGKPLLRHVYDQALQVGSPVVIATPDSRIQNYCRQNSIVCYKTSLDAPTGTHRCGEVMRLLSSTQSYDVVINWQCDEPFVNPCWVQMLINTIKSGGEEIATLVTPLELHGNGPNITKAAVSGYCHWFSRRFTSGAYKVHVGVYAYRWDALMKLSELQPTELSKAESLEQLAWIENGYRIRAIEVDETPLAINTKEDYRKFILVKGVDSALGTEPPSAAETMKRAGWKVEDFI